MEPSAFAKCSREPAQALAWQHLSYFPLGRSNFHTPTALQLLDGLSQTLVCLPWRQSPCWSPHHSSAISHHPKSSLLAAKSHCWLLQPSSGNMPDTLQSENIYLHTSQHSEKIKSRAGVFTPKLGLWVG